MTTASSDDTNAHRIAYSAITCMACSCSSGSSSAVTAQSLVATLCSFFQRCETMSFYAIDADLDACYPNTASEVRHLIPLVGITGPN
jgi:hypothetical protein